MKAWIGSSHKEELGLCALVFAHTRNEARSDASHTDELNGIDYIDIQIRRAPEFDGMEKSPPTIETLVMKHGWFTICGECDSVITAEDSPKWTRENGVRGCGRCLPIPARAAEVSGGGA